MQTLCRSIAVAILTLFLAWHPALADDAKVQAAQDAAASWLALVDQGDYAMSWTQAAPLFQGMVTEESWVASLEAIRTPLGDLMGRSIRESHYSTSLPGAPDGEYVVMIFETGFANKRSGVETVTFMLAPDGTWRLAGYYIK